MPRDGALILSYVRGPTLSIVCEPCGRRETYSVATLMERQGDAKLTDLLQTFAKARSASIRDRCRAIHSDDPRRRDAATAFALRHYGPARRRGWVQGQEPDESAPPQRIAISWAGEDLLREARAERDAPGSG
jgi:hypothetical protein